jgi:hypothetical protein
MDVQKTPHRKRRYRHVSAELSLTSVHPSLAYRGCSSTGTPVSRGDSVRDTAHAGPFIGSERMIWGDRRSSLPADLWLRRTARYTSTAVASSVLPGNPTTANRRSAAVGTSAPECPAGGRLYLDQAAVPQLCLKNRHAPITRCNSGHAVTTINAKRPNRAISLWR